MLWREGEVSRLFVRNASSYWSTVHCFEQLAVFSAAGCYYSVVVFIVAIEENVVLHSYRIVAMSIVDQYMHTECFQKKTKEIRRQVTLSFVM